MADMIGAKIAAAHVDKAITSRRASRKHNFALSEEHAHSIIHASDLARIAGEKIVPVEHRSRKNAEHSSRRDDPARPINLNSRSQMR